MITNRCIWCLKEAIDSDVEHVIPLSLGGPHTLVLPGSVVCRSCNNGLAYLDRAVADEYDILCFVNSVSGRDGRPPAIRGRGNLVASTFASAPIMTFNMEKFPVKAHDGTTVSGYQGKPRSVNAKLKVQGRTGTISFAQPFGAGRNFIRGVVKIGFSYFALMRDAASTHDNRYDCIREYVRFGTGVRHVMLIQCDDNKYQCGPASLLSSAQGEDAGVQFRIGHVLYFIDLVNDERNLIALQTNAEKLYGTSGWCVLPLV